MTRQEAIDIAPNSRKTYWSSFVVAALFSSVLWGFAVFATRKSAWLEAGSVLSGLVMLASAAQCWERIFRPERAAERSASLRYTQRAWIQRIRTGLMVCFAGLFAVSIVLFCFSEAQQKISNDLRIFMWTPYMLVLVLADLQGERIGVPRVSKRPGANILQGTLGPLQSEHWGERG